MSPDPARPDAAQTTGPEVVALRPEPAPVYEDGKDGEPDYLGREGAVSEHRTAGGRAWCHNCGEWCYSGTGMACRCCDEPFTRDEVIAHAEALAGERVREAEERIVAWLREDRWEQGMTLGRQRHHRQAADAIERGEHR